MVIDQNVFGFPDDKRVTHNLRGESAEALCILLNRLAYPCHYADMVNLFGRGPPQFSMIFNQTVDSIDANCEKLINAGCLALVYKLFLTLYTEKEQLLEICGISSMLQMVLLRTESSTKYFVQTFSCFEISLQIFAVQ